MPEPFSLSTPRLLIRPMLEADAGLLSVVRTHPRNAPFVPRPLAQTEAEIQDFLQKFRGKDRRQTGYFGAICLSETQALIGSISYLRFGVKSMWAEVAYEIHPDHWGHGYATEALRAILGHVFQVMRPRIQTVKAIVNPQNLASCQVLTHCHFEEKPILSSQYWEPGRWGDVSVYELDRRRWSTGL